MLKSRNNLWRPENSSFCIKMTLTFCRKTLKKPPLPPLKCSLWEELQRLGSCWGGVSETECDGISEDWKTLRIYTSECCQNALLSASHKKKNLLTKREMCEKSIFFLPPPLSVFWCHLSTAVGEVVAFKVRNIQKLYYFSNRIFGTGTSGSFEGEATRSQHWSEVLLAGRKYGSR